MTELAIAAPADAGLSADGLARIDAWLSGLIGEGTLAGAVTLVARHGRVCHTSVLGKKDLATGEPLALDTLFRIFSMTKPVTAAAMMILHDRGLWSPDDPIARHLPEFAGVQVFRGLEASGAAIVEPPDHPPTLGELLTHTAGLLYGFEARDGLDKLYQAADIWGGGDLAGFSRRVAALPLAFQPGTQWAYGVSMDIQGAIIERLSGQTLPAFMAEHIFGPLGMVDTAFHTPPEKRGRLATLYRASPRRGLVPLANPLMPDYDAPPALASGGGGLISTASDYARFAQMLLNGGTFAGRRIVSQAGVRAMMTNQISDALMAGGYGVGLQQIRPGFGFGYNGVVFTDPKAAGIPVGKGTYHWDGAAGTWFWVDPENDLLYVGLVQRLGENAPRLQATTQTLMAEAILQEAKA